jgi:hypothetical protein
MTIGLATSVRTSRMQAIVTAAGAGAKFKFYDGSRPATGAAIGAHTLLATLVGGSTIGTVTAGVLDFDEASFTQNTASHVTGTPTWLRCTTSADAFVADFSIPTDISFSGTIVNGVTIPFNASTLTEGNA